MSASFTQRGRGQGKSTAMYLNAVLVRAHFFKTKFKTAKFDLFKAFDNVSIFMRMCKGKVRTYVQSQTSYRSKIENLGLYLPW